MDQEPKARLVDRIGSAPVEKFVVKVTRPHGDPPAFWTENELGELKLCFPFDSEQGRVFSQLIGDDGVSYHKAYITSEGELGIEREALEGLSW